MDAENRLVSSSAGAALAWDPLGRLFQTGGGPAGVTRFLHDGEALVAEYSEAGAVLRRYVHGQGADEPLAAYEGASVAPADERFLMADHQGSIVLAFNRAGAVLALNSYDEYGIPAAGNADRFQYTGQAWLPELGMYHYKARIYSPTLGRFLQVDPVGYKDQINLYAYVGNDPVDGRDPSGECGPCVLVIPAAAEALGAGAVLQGLGATALFAGVVATYERLNNDAKEVKPGVSDGSRKAVPGTGRDAGRVTTGSVRPGQPGPPKPGGEVKKSDAPKEAARGGRYGGVIGSKTQGGKMAGDDHRGHQGGPNHTHPTPQQGQGHFWEKPR